MTDIYEKYAPIHDWWDSTFYDAKAIGALMGFDIDDIYFSGFSSQGDGACFTGALHYRKGAAAAVKSYAPLDLELHRIASAWQDAHKAHGWKVTATVKHSGYYNHANCTSFDFEDPRHIHDWTQPGFNESAFIEPARDFMRWIYRQLETESEYQFASGLALGWIDRANDMAEARTAARQLVSDMRAARDSGISAAESICQALRRSLRELANAWEAARKERAEIADSFWYRDSDGAQWNVEKFAAQYV